MTGLRAELWDRALVALGALAGLGAVAMAAVASHALPGRLDAAELSAVASAVQMQGWHALALVACGTWAARGGWPARLAGLLFGLGTALFCAGVYVHALGGVSLGRVAPTGGVLLMAGWALLAVSAVRRP